MHNLHRSFQIKKMKNQKLLTLVRTSLYCALIFTASWICFPTANGNVNLGDGVILLCAWNLGGWQSVVAAAVGSALTDLSGGFALWAPGTVIIKSLVTLTAIAGKKATEKKYPTGSLIYSAIAAELVMTVGYLVYETVVLSFGEAALLNVPANLLQASIATTVSFLGVKYLPFHIVKYTTDRGNPKS